MGISGVLPTVHKRFLSAVFAAFLGLLAAAPGARRRSPKVKTAYPVDRDRDGHVDGVSLKWSKKVRGGADRKAPFAVPVRGYRVTSVGRRARQGAALRVAERPECDTGGSVRLAFRNRRGRRPGQAVARQARRRPHKLDMRRFDLPIPRITCAVTLDADADARIDGVRLTYSRDVRSDAQTSGRFLFSVAGYKSQGGEGGARAASSRSTSPSTTAPDSGAKPAIGYSQPAKKSQRRFAVRAGKRGDAFSGSYQSTRDGVAPQLVSGRDGRRRPRRPARRDDACASRSPSSGAARPAWPCSA